MLQTNAHNRWFMLQYTPSNENKGVPMKTKKKNIKNILGGCVVVVILIIAMSSETPNFACDETTMQQAQDLANENYPNWNNSLKLKEPTVVKQEENYLKCRVKTNLRNIPVMHYELTKDEDGDMLIGINPFADSMDAARDEWKKDMDNLLNEW